MSKSLDFLVIEQLHKRIYEKASYHGKVDTAIKSKAPKNRQEALDSSVQVKLTSPRRVGVDKINKELVVLDQTLILLLKG